MIKQLQDENAELKREIEHLQQELSHELAVKGQLEKQTKDAYVAGRQEASDEIGMENFKLM